MNYSFFFVLFHFKVFRSCFVSNQHYSFSPLFLLIFWRYCFIRVHFSGFIQFIASPLALPSKTYSLRSLLLISICSYFLFVFFVFKKKKKMFYCWVKVHYRNFRLALVMGLFSWEPLVLYIGRLNISLSACVGFYVYWEIWFVLFD